MATHELLRDLRRIGTCTVQNVDHLLKTMSRDAQLMLQCVELCVDIATSRGSSGPDEIVSVTGLLAQSQRLHERLSRSVVSQAEIAQENVNFSTVVAVLREVTHYYIA